MSNRLTFSLASLILIFTLGLIAMPAMAATGGPTVTFAEYSGVENPAADPATQTAATAQHTQARDDFRVKVTFSEAVSGVTADDFMYRLAGTNTGFGTPVEVPTLTNVWTSASTTSNTEYVLTLFTSEPGTANTRLFVTIEADRADSISDAVGNQAGRSATYTMPDLLAPVTVKFGDVEAVANTNGRDYTVDVIFENTTDDAGTALSNLDPVFVASGETTSTYLMISPENDATVSISEPGEEGTTADTTTGGVGEFVHTITVSLNFGVDPLTGVTLTIDPGYALMADGMTATVKVATTNMPPAWPDTAAAMVTGTVGTDITPVDAGGAMDPEGDTITYTWDAPTTLGLSIDSATGEISGTPATLYDNSGDDGDDPVMVTATSTGGEAMRDVTITINRRHPSVTKMEVSELDIDERTFKLEIVFMGAMPALTAMDFDADDLNATYDMENSNATLTVEDQQFTAASQKYVALLKYNRLAELPLTVTIKDSFETATPDNRTVMVQAPIAPMAPGAPTAVMAAANQTANTITVSWTAPTDDGNSAITGYTVTKHYTMPDGTAAEKDFSATASPLTIPPAGSADMVPQGVSFTFTVKAINSVGTGPASTASAPVMINVDTPVVTNPLVQPTNVMASAQNDGTVMVTWDWSGRNTAETAALDGFTVMLGTLSFPAAGRSHTVPASMLTAGQSYAVSVLARAKAGSGYETPTAGTSGPSVTPIDPDALRFANTISNMTFTAGTAIGSTAMPYIQLPRAHGGTSVVYTYSLLKGIGKVDVTDTGDNGLTVDKVNLHLMGTPAAPDTTGTLYTWRVINGDDSKELEFTITVNAAPVITPTNMKPVVTIATPTPQTPVTGTFTISYTATDDGNPAGSTLTETVTPATGPTGYTIMHNDAANTVTITQSATAALTAITVTITSSDRALTSDPKSITVIFAARTAPPALVAPSVVQNFSVSAQDGQVTLSWMKPATGDVESYQYSYNDAREWINIPDSTAATTMHIVKGLTNGSTYNFVVRATNSENKHGAVSPELSATPQPGEVTPPDAATVTITGPVSLSCNPNTPNRIMLAVAGTTEKLATGDITVGAGWKLGMDNDPSDGAVDLIPAGNGSEIGVTSVAVGVNANAVGKNAAASMTFTVGPVLTIPAGGYIVVARTAHISSTHLNRPLYLGSLGVSGVPVNIQDWDCMPDLAIFFGRSGAGIGGGAISVKQSHAHTGDAIGTGTVGISEIMWGSDEGILFGHTSNIEAAREQWIELHNTNNRTVTVTLFARPSTTVINNERAPVIGDSSEIDRMSNFNLGGVWNVKGQNGNSALGTDFVSMYRSKNGNPYTHADNNGRNGGKWHVSSLVYRTDRSALAGEGATNPTYNFKGTPGRSNTISAVGPVTRTNVPNSPIIFNEIANRRDQTLEWIELKNVSDAARDLRNYEIGLVTAVGTEHRFFHFAYGDNQVIMQPGETLLLVDTDPRYNDDHPVAVGYNVRGNTDQALGLGANAPRYLVTNFREGGLPDDGNFILILRTSKGDEGYDNKKGTTGHLSDAIGWHSNLAKQGPPLYTNLWPFSLYGHPNKGRNKIEVETVHYRRHAGHDPDQGDNNKAEQIALNNAGYTGVGYKRFASRHNPAHGGTPGYDHNGLVKQLTPDIGGAGVVTISEIMLDQSDGRYPQWIELYNSSDKPVNLHAGDHGWRLVIENFDDGEIPINRLEGTLNFRSSDVQTIQAKQTVLVASTRARSSGSAFFDTNVIFPPTRVFSVWDDARGALDMKRPADPILSTEGFYIELLDGKNNVSDSIGNLVPNPNRRVATQNKIEWPLTDITGEINGEPRSSILRRYRKPAGGDSRMWVPYTSAQLIAMGITAEGWVLASKTDFRDVRQTWYGHGDDIGSPGITGGRILPVEMSRFRPERLDDGSVAIRWITESETNNAGFNILRSESKSGEFTKLNTQLIAGQDTTSESTAYEFVDKTAKPNVVYYYQIQDVSLDGDVSTLAVTHLRGHVSAAGKATTTWGDIKSLQ